MRLITATTASDRLRTPLKSATLATLTHALIYPLRNVLIIVDAQAGVSEWTSAHRHHISAVSVTGDWLLSASDDVCALWRTSREQPVDAWQLQETHLLTDLGSVHALVANNAQRTLYAALAGNFVWVLDCSHAEIMPLMKLEGHFARVNDAVWLQVDNEPSKWYILTVSEDRTFKIWCTDRKVCVFQSDIISSSPFTTVTITPDYKTLFIGSQDGKVRVYQINSFNATHSIPVEARCTSTIELDRTILRFQQTVEKNNADCETGSHPNNFQVVSSVPSWRRMSYADVDNDKTIENITETAQISQAVLYLWVCPIADVYPNNNSNNTEDQNDGIQNQLLSKLLIIATSSQLLLFNIDTLELIDIHDFTTATNQQNTEMIGLISGLSLILRCSQTKRAPFHTITVTVCSKFQPQIFMLDFQIGNVNNDDKDRSLEKTLAFNLSNLELTNVALGDLDTPLWRLIELVCSAQLGNWYRRAYQSALAHLHTHSILTVRDFISSDKQEKDGQMKTKIQPLDSLPPYLVFSLRAIIREHFISNTSLELSFAPVHELALSSPLRSGFTSNTIASKSSGIRNTNSTCTKTTKLGSTSLDKPITFRSKISSSGYAKAPQSTHLFKNPETNRAVIITKKKIKDTSIVNSTHDIVLPEFMYTRSMAHDTIAFNTVPSSVLLHQSPITSVRYAYNGKLIGTASMDKSCCVATVKSMREALSFTNADPDRLRTFTNANTSLLDMSWSTNSEQFLTTSNTSVQLWSVHQVDTPLLTIDSPGGNFELTTTSTTSLSLSQSIARSPKPLLSGKSRSSSRLTTRSDSNVMNTSSMQEKLTKKGPILKILPTFRAIRSCRFFYGDKFVLVADKEVYMLKYHLNTLADKNDIKPKLCSNKYKLVTRFASSSAHAVTAFHVSNQARSPLIIVGTSDKGISIFDANVNQLVHTQPEVHERPVHCIQANDSFFNSNELNHVFVTAAVTDCIRLWDLRTSKCFKRLQGHQNRFANIGCAISPCGRFLASGSEDKSAYIYDVRGGRVYSKISGFNDTVLWVDWHPYRPELACVTSGGHLRLVDMTYD